MILFSFSSTYYGIMRLSHDLVTLLFFFNSLLIISLAAIWMRPFSCVLWGVGVSSFVDCFWVSLIWRTMPTNNSSTRWFSAADISMYLQCCFSAKHFPSEIDQNNLSKKAIIFILLMVFIKSAWDTKWSPKEFQCIEYCVYGWWEKTLFGRNWVITFDTIHW